MGLYESYVLPRFLHLLCGLKPVIKQRERIVPLAAGRVLEIGIGSGLNLPFYTAENVEILWGLEPSQEMCGLAKKNLRTTDIDVEFINAPAEDVPLDTGSVDTVLLTYTLCTIPDACLALEEMRRVLKPDGKLLFCEHGLAPHESVRKWQNRLNPTWKRFVGGCNINRPIPDLIEKAGFSIQDLETGYISCLKPASFNFWGSATRR